MWPFFTFYGGKWRAAPRYPKPNFGTIIEPFAGAAGYSVRNYSRDVILVERDPTIAALWRFLIGASADEIASLPLIPLDGHIDALKVCAEAKTLIGFWLNKGTAAPCRSPGKWMREGLRPKSFWGPEIRARIAGQVDRISHWRIIEGEYSDAPDMDATWFIDPPYSNAGKLYKFGSNLLDYASLASWARDRQGQTMVCEHEGAAWLPFVPFAEIKSTEGKHGKAKSAEAIWLGPDESTQSKEPK